MPRVEQNNSSSIPISLHYALTDSQCGKCGGQLEWSPEFDDINQPKYTSEHCNEEYAIYIDTVKVEIVASKQGEDEEKVISLQEEPRAIRMADGMKLEEGEQK
jgi:hypothetical protein